MATSMCKSKVVCGHWIKIGRYYYCSMIGMTCRSIYNISTSLSISNCNKVRLRNVEHNFTNKMNSKVGSSDNYFSTQNLSNFRLESDSAISKEMHMRNHQSRNSNIDRRWYSDDRGPPRKSHPKLMDFPEIVWPSVIKTLRNWILANLIIKPYFDQEFRLPDFVFGSKQAVECVSGCLAKGDYSGLDNMVTKDAMEEVRKNMSTFTLQQRQDLALCKEDIYFSFPYQIGVMFSDDDKNQQRFVEITMCYHVLHGLNEMSQQGVTPPLNMGMLPEYRDKLSICNYRFIREFTKGVEDEWTVNVVNHFKPGDLVS